MPSASLVILQSYQNGGLVEVSSEGQFTIYFIPPDQLAQAFDEDQVVVTEIASELTAEHKDTILEYAPTYQAQINEIKVAKIASIVTRHVNHQKISGVLKIKSNTVYGIGKSGGQYYLFCPTDCKYPNFTVLSRAKANEHTNHLYIVAKFQEWLPASKHPRGCCEEVIGEIGQMDNEIQARLYHHHLAVPSGKKAIKDEMTQIAQINMVELIKDRVDFRQTHIFSIDPPGCKDVDDALHITETEIGFTIGIHIADVSAFVKPGSQLDNYAKQRMTSLYLPNGTKHMLPSEISEGKCSLLEGQDRLALSLILQVDAEGEITKWDFLPSVIKNHRQLTYEQAENYLANPDANQYSRKLATLHGLLNKINHGGRYYTSSGETIGDTTPNAHYVVETCMVLANILCAKNLITIYGNCILRHHEVGNQEYLETSMSLLDSQGQSENQVLKHYLKMRSQVSAQYHSFHYLKNHQLATGHFGLKAEHYTHFTSPIRRYVDLINHRLLKGETADLDQLDQLCVQMNLIHLRAKRLYRDLAYLALINRLTLVGGDTDLSAEDVTAKAMIVQIVRGQPSLKVKLYLPEYKVTLSHVICHHKVSHLYEITAKNDGEIQLYNKETEEAINYQMFRPMTVKLTPILNSEIFTKKMRLSELN
jgi:exoribonuclease R